MSRESLDIWYAGNCVCCNLKILDTTFHAGIMRDLGLIPTTLASILFWHVAPVASEVIADMFDVLCAVARKLNGTAVPQWARKQ